MENRPLEKEHNIEHAHDTASPQGSSSNNSLSHGTPDGKTPKKAKSSKSGSKKESEPSASDSSSIPIRRWFVTLMCMNIPIIGWIYLIILACSRSRSPRKDFAKAYLLYKLVFLLLSLAILAVAIHYGMALLDQVLAYMEML